jgi:hypothetical protein
MKVNLSLAAFPGMRHEAAAASGIADGVAEPLFGDIATEHVQLVPQNLGVLDEAMIHRLREAHPHTQFRLHANVRVLRDAAIYDLSNFDALPAHFARAASLSKHLKAPAYSAHAGRRNGSLESVLDATRRASELFGCDVALEGHYPERGNTATYFVSTWEEYREVFESGVAYALDLSHLNIVAHYERRRETGLVAEMLACERCIEVHLSDNNGCGDQHQTLNGAPWWWSLRHFIHSSAVVFTEGNQRRSIADRKTNENRH